MSTPSRRIVMAPRNVVRVGATVLLALVGVGGLGGTAHAFWAASGTGSGAAQAGVAQLLTTSATTVSGDLLYPGATADVSLAVDNPNPFPVTITSIVGSGAITSDTGPACDAATGVVFTDPPSPSLAVGASSSATFTLTGAVAMDNSSDDSCQGATFTIPVVLTGASG